MKKPAILLIVLVAMLSSYAQSPLKGSNTIIYMVRHAEKEAGADPELTAQGKQRAGDLYKLMRDVKLARIYTTPYRRTSMTADSLRLNGAIDTVYYDADTTGHGLVRAIVQNNDLGKEILVIGHSNTLLRMARAFGVEGLPSDIPDEEFDNIYTISFKEAKPLFSARKYGAPSANKK